MAHTPIGQCTSDCRRIGCPEENLCAYCGENKWENKNKHLSEASEFIKKAAQELGRLRQKKNPPTREYLLNLSKQGAEARRKKKEHN